MTEESSFFKSSGKSHFEAWTSRGEKTESISILAISLCNNGEHLPGGTGGRVASAHCPPPPLVELDISYLGLYSVN